MQKRFYKNITVGLCKKPLEKTQIFEKRDFFKIRPSCKGYSPCKGYNVCKMVSLDQKLKFPRTYEKRFYKVIGAFLSKKTARKNTKYWRNETNLKIGHLAKTIDHAKAIAYAKWSVWGKN